MYKTQEEQCSVKKIINGITLNETTQFNRSYYELDIWSLFKEKVKDINLDLTKELLVVGDVEQGMNLILKTDHNVEFVGDVAGNVTIISLDKKKSLAVNVQGSVKSSGSFHIRSQGTLKIEGDIESNATIIAKEFNIEIGGSRNEGAKIQDKTTVHLNELYSPPSSRKVQLTTSTPPKQSPVKAKTKTIQSPLMQKSRKQMATYRNMFSNVQTKLSEETPINHVVVGQHSVLTEQSPKQKHRTTKLVDVVTMQNELLQQQRSESWLDSELKTYLYEVGEAEQEALDKSSEAFAKKRPEIVNRLNHLVNFLNKNPVISFADKGKNLKLLPPQVNLLATLNDFLKEGRSGYFDCATGYGKSVVMAALTLIFNGRNRFDFPVLIVVSRTVLISQIIAEIKKYSPDIPIGIYDGDHKQADNLITITTYSSLHLQMQKEYENRDLKLERFHGVFLDEAHHALSAGIHEYIRRYIDANCGFGLGYTATPAYNTSREPGALSSLDELLGKCIYSYFICQGIKNGILSPCMNIIVDVTPDLEMLAHLNRSRKKNEGNDKKRKHDYSEDELAHFKQNKFNQIPVQIITKYCIEETQESLVGKPGILFTIDRQQGRECAELINEGLKNHPYYKENKIQPAAYIGSDLSKPTRQMLLDKHKKGEITWLCCSDYLNEGYDSRVRIIINMRPTRSIVLAKQRSGRGLRLGDGPSLIIDINWGIEQIFFNRFLDNNLVYGKIRKAKNAVPFSDVVLETILDVAPFTIKSGLALIKAKIDKAIIKEVVQSTYEKLSFQLEAFTEISNEYDVTDLPPPPPLSPVGGKKREHTAGESDESEEFGFFKRIKSLTNEEQQPLHNFNFNFNLNGNG